MKHPLNRLLRLRTLLEDISRVELEVRLQELTQIEGVLTRSQEIGRAMRQRSFLSIAKDEIASRLQAAAVTEWVAREQDIFEKMHQRKVAEVAAAKSTYLDRRKDSRQVGNVIETRESAMAIERSRREQREIDDWFGQRSQSKREGGMKPA